MGEGVKTIFKVEASRTIRSNKSTEMKYYLTSRDLNAEKLLKLARSHWSVENQLHYILDVSFNEDASRLRDGFTGENLAVIRQLCLNLIKKEETKKKSVKTKRLKCGWDENFLTKVLLGPGEK